MRNRAKTWMGVACGLLMCGGACTSERSEGEQARELLAHISSLDPTESHESRKRRLAGLERLRLREPALARVRDLCLTAHRGLLQAELEQKQASEALERAAARYGDAGIPADEARAIAAQIERSNRALAEADQALPDCDRQSVRLAKRYR